MGVPSGSDGKESACNVEDWVGSLGQEEGNCKENCKEILPWRRKLQPTLAFLCGEFHGQRSLASYSPWGGKESDMTE